MYIQELYEHLTINYMKPAQYSLEVDSTAANYCTYWCSNTSLYPCYFSWQPCIYLWRSLSSSTNLSLLAGNHLLLSRTHWTCKVLHRFNLSVHPQRGYLSDPVPVTALYTGQRVLYLALYTYYTYLRLRYVFSNEQCLIYCKPTDGLYYSRFSHACTPTEN